MPDPAPPHIPPASLPPGADRPAGGHSGTVAIIGAGPAGLAAAEVLAAGGARIAVYDAMPSPARKFLMAGRGGLNLTHSEPFTTFLTRYGAAANALRPALEAFPPDALRTWAAGLGEETFVGSSGRVFPRSFKASPLLRAWLRRLDSAGVRVHLRHAWTGWSADGSLAFGTPEGPLRVHADATILALGGASWPRLGSTGGWAATLREKGVAVHDFAPSNMGVRLAWSEPFRARFAGTPLKRIALTFHGRRVAGEAMVTQDGLEGGSVYALSAALRDALVVALPLAPVCRDDCPGLCPQCGARLADDPDHRHEQYDPRWAALGALSESLTEPTRPTGSGRPSETINGSHEKEEG